jgi:hypothetical protein
MADILNYQAGGTTALTGGSTAITPTPPEEPGIVGKQTGQESSLSNWAGPYVTDMLGKGAALATQPYEAYTGPLTAGPSEIQSQAFQGIGGLAAPTAQMGAYTPQAFGAAQAGQYMNPYIQQALQPQLDELNRQQQIKRIANASRLTQAGAYGGGRQAVMESELDRAYLDKAAGITGQGYMDAYNKAQQQFNTEQQLGLAAQSAANTYGLAALQKMADLGATQQSIEQKGIEADKAQFEEEVAFPYKQLQYQQSLLQGLPLAAQSYSYAQPSSLSNILSGAQGAQGLAGGIMNLFKGWGDTLPGISEWGIPGGGTTSDATIVPDFLPGVGGGDPAYVNTEPYFDQF